MRGRSNENKTEHRFIFRSKWTGSGPYSPRAGRVDGVCGGTWGRVGPRWSLGGSGPLGAVGGRAGGEGGREEGEKGCLSQPTGVRYHSWPNPLVLYTQKHTVQYCSTSTTSQNDRMTQESIRRSWVKSKCFFIFVYKSGYKIICLTH